MPSRIWKTQLKEKGSRWTEPLSFAQFLPNTRPTCEIQQRMECFRTLRQFRHRSFLERLGEGIELRPDVAPFEFLMLGFTPFMEHRWDETLLHTATSVARIPRSAIQHPMQIIIASPLNPTAHPEKLPHDQASTPPSHRH
jgi:hypothetical protein